MFNSHCICALLTATCCFITLVNSNPKPDKSPVLNLVSREKRWVAELLTKLGKAASELLLKGARPIASDKVFRVFRKSGSFDDALSDFYATSPSYVWKYKNQYGVLTLEGKVGDRHLFLTSRGDNKTPTLDIIDYRKAEVRSKLNSSKKVNGQPIDRIIYTSDGV